MKLILMYVLDRLISALFTTALLLILSLLAGPSSSNVTYEPLVGATVAIVMVGCYFPSFVGGDVNVIVTVH